MRLWLFIRFIAGKFLQPFQSCIVVQANEYIDEQYYKAGKDEDYIERKIATRLHISLFGNH